MSTHLTASLLLLVALAVPARARLPAQEPGPAADTAAAEPDRWGAEVALSLNSAGGNEHLTVLNTDVGLTHLETDAYELALGGQLRYGRSEGEEVANSVRGSITADLWPERRWSPFVFATAERDRIKKLDLRLGSGAGVKRTFYRDDRTEASLSGAVLYAYESTAVEPAAGDGITRTARWSWRARASHEIREGTRFEQTVFYQPAWNEFADYLVEARTAARFALTRTLAFTLTGLYQRDSTPAPEVGPDDWSVAAGLSLATAW